MHKMLRLLTVALLAAVAVGCGDVEIKSKSESVADAAGLDTEPANDVGPDNDAAAGTDASEDGASGQADSGAGDDSSSADAAPDTSSQVAQPPTLCNPCAASADCVAVVGKKSKCADHDGLGNFCGAGCSTDADCRVDFFCREVTAVEGDKAQQCVPRKADSPTAIGACFCSDDARDKGMSTACYNALTEAGKVTAKCAGTRSCTAQGLSECDAKTPSKDICDGIDNDCDGATDAGGCDDGEPCTTDACDKAGKCVNTATAGGCDDGDACTAGDSCATGTCKGIEADCDDGNACTTDSCVAGEGCKNAKIAGCSICTTDKSCDDGDACTDDKCIALSGKCAHPAKVCDDGDDCTIDACDKQSGTCVASDGGACGGARKLPFSANFDCTSKANALWSLTPAAKGAPGWAIDGTPTPPIAKSPTCSLNFNNGTDYTCPAGASGVAGTATSPWLDATDAHPSANIRLTYSYGGKWENNNNDELRVLYTVDGKQWNVVADINSPSSLNNWNSASASLSAAKGKLFRLQFQFFTTSCDKNDTAGPFIDDVRVFDASCHSHSDCSTSNPCTVVACINHNCQATSKCNDDNPCTTDSCSQGKCAPKPVAAGTACSDASGCTGAGTCAAGVCAGGAVKQDGTPCTDGKQCTVADTCKGGVCQGAASCDDGNPCTADSCWLQLGQCAHEPLAAKCDDASVCTADDACEKGVCTGKKKDCDDADVCTVDTCGAIDGKCTHTGGLCDDGDSCTADTCDKVTGACLHKAGSECGAATVALPYEQPFECGAPSTKTWQLTSGGGGPEWKIDGDPVPPGSNSGSCSLNFNDGKNYACPTGKTAVQGTATSPWIDATAVTSSQLRLEFRVSGSWETNNDDELYVQASTDGTAWQTIYDTGNTNPSYWYLRALNLSNYQGKKFKLRFEFKTVDCDKNDGVGPFIDDLRVWDAGCKSAADCDDGNLCRTWTCNSNGTCGASNKSCTDDEPCTSNACDAKTGKCLFPFTNDGSGCNDDNACTHPDRCQAGKCHGQTLDCDDGSACTKDACDPKKGCVLTPICDDGDPCTADLCDEKTQKCGTKAAADGFGCDDADRCSTFEACAQGKCAGKSLVVGTATPTTLSAPAGAAADGKGKAWVVERGKSFIHEFSAGKLTHIAGATPGFEDGEALKARFNQPYGLAWGAGTLYIADTYNNRIRALKDGKVTTFAGSGSTGWKDGPSKDARLYRPYDLAVGPKGNLVVADTYNYRIRRIDASGTVSTLAGASSGFEDGMGIAARFNRPQGIAIDADGVIYVADYGNHRIRKLAPSGAVTTLAGSAVTGLVDGIGPGARLYYPSGIALAEPGWLWLADTYNNAIRKLEISSGRVITVAGQSGGGYVDGAPGVARFNRPWDVVVMGPDSLLITDQSNSRVRSIAVAVGATCDDGNVCTDDGCAKDTGVCANEPAAKCDDKDPCTLDVCNPNDGKCAHSPEPCDDGDSCTTGKCEAKTGACSFAAASACNTIAGAVSYEQAFNCGSASAKQWELTSKGGPSWNIDATPEKPGSQTPKCSLNFNNGTDYACAAGAKAVEGTATSPWIDAATVSTVGGLLMKFRYSGRWETNNDDELYLEATTDDKEWAKLADISYTSTTSWGTWTVNVNAYAGKKFRLRWRFFTSDCEDNAWSGPFIDDISIRDLNCTSPKDCADGSACTTDTCAGGRCSWPGVNCNDYDACTNDACDVQVGCRNTYRGEGASCSDGDSCTTSDVCTKAKCVGVATGKDGATCSDSKNCTVGDVCAAGKCVGKPACDDANPCSANSCDKNGNCATEPDTKVCDDGSPCTVDACAWPAVQKCTHKPACDDENGCTTDACNATTGACTHTAVAGCQNQLPYATDFPCGAGAPGWTLASEHQGGPAWAFDKTPELPKPFVGDCTLNFNDGKSYACPAGATKLKATATSPWIDTSKAPKYASQLRVSMRIQGRWRPAGSTSTLYAEASLDDKLWTTVYTMNYNYTSWVLRSFNLSSNYAGSKFKLRFRFESQACDANTDSGAFIDALRIWDARCVADDQCDDNSACTISRCLNHGCSITGRSCDDGKPCTGDGCNAEFGCVHVVRPDNYTCGASIGCALDRCLGGACTKVPIADGAGCNDGDSCTASDKCNTGVCAGQPSLADKTPCSDSDRCTTADQCDKGACTGSVGKVHDGGGEGWGQPSSLAPLSNGDLVASDTNYHRLRRYSDGKWTVFVGGGYGDKDGKGALAQFRYPTGIDAAANDTVYVADRENHRIRVVSAAGEVTTLAGQKTGGFADGKGATAQFNRPLDVAAVGADVFVADGDNHRIRKVTADGTVTTVAGGAQGFADGIGAAAQFYRPAGIAPAGGGSVYVSDTYNHRIRHVTAAGTVTTFAGGTYGFADGTTTTARFAYPEGLRLAGDGLLYVADRNNNDVRRIDAQGRVVTVTGRQGYGWLDGALSEAKFSNPVDVVVDNGGVIWVADRAANRIRRIVIGAGNTCDDATHCTNNTCDTATGRCDNGPVDCDDANPCTVDLCGATDGKCASTAYGCDDGNPCTTDSCDKTKGCSHAIKKGCLACAAHGTDGAAQCGDGNPCTTDTCDAAKGCVHTAIGGCSGCTSAAQCADGKPCVTWTCAGGKCSGAADKSGALCDDGSVCTALDRCEKGACVGRSARLDTFSGSGEAANKSGAADVAAFNSPVGIAVDANGTVFVSDAGNKQVRLVNPWGYASGLFGTSSPAGMGIADDGALLVADAVEHRVKRFHYGWSTSVTIVAGTGQPGQADGPVKLATLNKPMDVCAGPAGSFFIADSGNDRLRKVDAAGAVTTVFLQGGTLKTPSGLDTDGALLWVADTGHGRLVRVDPTNGSLTVIAKLDTPIGVAVGKLATWIADAGAHSVSVSDGVGLRKLVGGVSGFVDGPLHVGKLERPMGIAVGPAGHLYIADRDNNRVRIVRQVGHVCGDGATCTGDWCDPGDGECKPGVALAASCDDGDACTFDFCHASIGKCVHTATTAGACTAP